MDRSSVSAGVSPPTTRTRTAQMPDGLCGRTERKRSNAACGLAPSSARTSGSESPSAYVRLKSMLSASRPDTLSLAMASAESMISRGEGRSLGYFVSPQLLRWPSSADGATRAARSARRAVVIFSAPRQLIDHEAPDPPTAGFAAPHGHVTTGAVDRRAGFGHLNLVVRPHVNRMTGGDEEVGARERERRDAVDRHLLDDQRVDGRAIHVRRAREQKADIVRELVQRHGRIAFEPCLAVLFEGGIYRIAIGRGIGHRSAAACLGCQNDTEYAGCDLFHGIMS